VQFSPYLLAYLPRWKGAAAAEPARDEERSKQAAAECNIDPDWVGAWVQESVENDKLDEIMKKEGALWLVRKAILSHKREFSVEVSEQGFVLLKTHVPAVTTLAFRVYPSEELAQPTTVAIIGVTGVATAFWEGQALVNKVVKSHKGRTDLITSRIVWELDKSTAGKLRLVLTNNEEFGVYRVVCVKKGSKK